MGRIALASRFSVYLWLNMQLFDHRYINCSCQGYSTIEKNEVGGACSTCGGVGRRVQGFGGETWGKETTG